MGGRGAGERSFVDQNRVLVTPDSYEFDTMALREARGRARVA